MSNISDAKYVVQKARLAEEAEATRRDTIGEDLPRDLTYKAQVERNQRAGDIATIAAARDTARLAELKFPLIDRDHDGALSNKELGDAVAVADPKTEKLARFLKENSEAIRQLGTGDVGGIRGVSLENIRALNDHASGYGTPAAHGESTRFASSKLIESAAKVAEETGRFSRVESAEYTADRLSGKAERTKREAVAEANYLVTKEDLADKVEVDKRAGGPLAGMAERMIASEGTVRTIAAARDIAALAKVKFAQLDSDGNGDLTEKELQTAVELGDNETVAVAKFLSRNHQKISLLHNDYAREEPPIKDDLSRKDLEQLARVSVPAPGTAGIVRDAASAAREAERTSPRDNQLLQQQEEKWKALEQRLTEPQPALPRIVPTTVPMLSDDVLSELNDKVQSAPVAPSQPMKRRSR